MQRKVQIGDGVYRRKPPRGEQAPTWIVTVAEDENGIVGLGCHSGTGRTPRVFVRRETIVVRFIGQEWLAGEYVRQAVARHGR